MSSQEPNPDAHPSTPAGGTITNSLLGGMGYYGNQLFQYAFLKTYAAAHDLHVECPPWIGNYLFAADDPPISRVLPVVEDVGDQLIPQSKEVFRNCDFRGYFQYRTSYYAPYRDLIRSLFQPRPEIRDLVKAGWQRVAQQGRTVVGLHLRRNDFGQGFVYITPSSWYLRWLEEIWPQLADPVLFIASDEPAKVLRDFKAYRPLSGREMQVGLPKAPYYPDFYALTQCDLLAIPNSTFSFAAAMLNSRLQKSVRSILPLQSFVEFDPWDDDPLHRQFNAEDFKHIPGVAMTRYGRCVRLIKRLGKKIAGRKDRP
jgi:hypothetical protein